MTRQDLRPHRIPRSRREWEEFAAFGYAGGGGLLVGALWFFIGWTIVSGGSPFGYETGNTPLVPVRDPDTILGVLGAMVLLLGGIGVWWFGALWAAFVVYERLERSFAQKVGDHNTVIGSILGSVVGVVVSVLVLFLVFAWIMVVAVLYAFAVAVGFVLLSAVAGALRR